MVSSFFSMRAAVLILKAVALLFSFSGAAATWCVVRSDASEQAMQRALDYACAAGADCAPIQSSGLCYLPNTLPAHASYAINSFYQRTRANTPNSCYFGGAAATAATDPSYGSCVYPSSPRNAGGRVPTTSSSTTATPTLTEPLPSTPPPSSVGGGVLNFTESPTFNASPTLYKRNIFITFLIFLLVFLHIFQTT